MKYTAVKHASSTAKTPTQSKKSTPSKTVHNVTSSRIDCPACNHSGHPLSQCRRFWDLDVDRRQKIARDAKLCYNCLSYDHTSKGCASRFNCRHCGAKHHSALHKGTTGKESSPTKAEETKALHANSPTSSFLSTAMSLANHNGACQKARALLDQGASLSLITENLATALKLPRKPVRLKISGLQGICVSKHYVDLTLCSVHNAVLLTP